MIKKFFKDGLIYIIPTILSRGISFFLLPIYTRYFSPSEYGFIDLLSALYVVLALVLPLEVSQAVSRLMADEKNAESKSELVSTAFWFTFCVFAVFGVFAMLIPQVIAQALDGDLRHVTAVRIAGLAMPLNALLYAVQNQLRWSLAAKSSSIVGLVFTFVTATVTVTLLVLFDMGVEAVVIGQAVGSFIGLCVGISSARKHIPLIFSFQISRLKHLLNFSMPLVLSSATYYGATFADRWMLKTFMSMEDVGIYAVALKISSVVGIIISSAQMALSPLVYSRYKLPETPGDINRLFGYFLLFALSLLCTLGLVAETLIEIMTDASYHQASGLIVLLSSAVIFSGAYVFAPGLSIAKKTKQIATISISVMLINLSLNYLFIPLYGRMGAALATLTGSIFLFLLFVFLAGRYYSIPYNWFKYILSIIIVTIFLLYGMIAGFSGVMVIPYVLVLLSLCLLLINSEDKQKIWCELVRKGGRNNI
ncbi:MAG: hypothetical protein COB49_12135 [Alphaproteobacteria bacterium]|nr:MAG: hypothetical protein COB49_12135 [Alphaproteobacteria bacterium]